MTSKDDRFSSVITSYLGVPTLKLRDSLKLKASNFVQTTRNKVNSKIENTITDIKNIPSSIKKAIINSIDNSKLAAKKKVDTIVFDIKSSPENLKKATIKAIEDSKLSAQKKDMVYNL
jgi:hypothetical protein